MSSGSGHRNVIHHCTADIKDVFIDFDDVTVFVMVTLNCKLVPLYLSNNSTFPRHNMISHRGYHQ